MKKLVWAATLILLISGCSQKTVEDEYSFEINGLEITMGETAGSFLTKTGNPMEQYSAPSCAFDGDDTVYDFGSYQITTYLTEGKEIFTGVYLLDDTVSTKEDIKIGSKLSEMISVYGDKYQENYGAYTYSFGLTDLSFVIIDDVITSISYLHKVE